MRRAAEWIVTRPWIPGNAQLAVEVETLRALTAIMESLTESLTRITESLTRIEAQLVVPVERRLDVRATMQRTLDERRAEHLGSAPMSNAPESYT